MSNKSDFRRFYLALTDDERERFAKQIGSSVDYIRVHLIAPPARRRVPRKALVDKMAKACEELGSSLTKRDLLAYFYETPA